MSAKVDFSVKPPLGGWLPAVEFSARQTSILNAIADELIPGGDGFPAPSAVDVVGFIAKYTTPRGQEAKWFPHFAEEDFKARLDAFGESFVKTRSEERVEVLRGVEWNEAPFFARLRDIVYLAYYSRPEVIRAINNNLEAGKDYRNTPQPYGYSSVMLDWDKALLSRVRGTYKRTVDVARVNLEGLAQ